MNQMKILVAEDEEKIAKVLVDYLKADGFEPHWIGEGNRVIDHVDTIQPQLLLLDVMLPGTDGMTILKQIRQNSSLPIIMVTARVEEIDRLLGLELGADDYICKPFSPREVLARIKSVLRRSGHGETPPPRNPLRIDHQRFQAFAGNQLLNLTRNEFILLQVLSEHPGRVYSRTQLLDKLYDDERAVSDRTIDSHIKNLRKKVSQALPEWELILSVYGVGYKFQLENKS